MIELFYLRVRDSPIFGKDLQTFDKNMLWLVWGTNYIIQFVSSLTAVLTRVLSLKAGLAGLWLGGTYNVVNSSHA